MVRGGKSALGISRYFPARSRSNQSARLGKPNRHARLMPIEQRGEGKVEYTLANRDDSDPTLAPSRATNRQRKLLRFFAVPFSPNISVGAAGWEIAGIMSNDENREQWRRYLFLTGDFDSDTDALAPCDMEELRTVRIPEGWSSGDALRQFREELVSELIHDQSPFDCPQPEIHFANRTFIFTGKFSFGPRKGCQDAVTGRGGSAPDQKSVSREIDYLVIGTEGSKAWSKGAYGNKIEQAILSRRDHGAPAIISEAHWAAALSKV